MTSDLFITFGGGRRGFQLAANRLGSEVANSSWDADVLVLDTKTASDLIGVEWDIHKSFFEKFSKGYGLWLWKSIILKAALLGRFGAYSRIFYLDAGSQFSLENPNSTSRFFDYLDLAEKYAGLAFTHKSGQFGIDDFSEKLWGAPELHRAMTLDKNILDSPQIQAGCLFLTIDSLPVIEDWYTWSIRDSYSFLTGISSICQRENEFQHRFDQSILSPLWHQANLLTLQDETWFGPNWSEEGKNFPIWTIRNDSSLRLPVMNVSKKIRHRTQILSSLLIDKWHEKL
jgi:hypothetical protein